MQHAEAVEYCEQAVNLNERQSKELVQKRIALANKKCGKTAISRNKQPAAAPL